MSKKGCIYARVSTADGKQDYSRQVNDLQKFMINSLGYKEENIDVYSEMISGFKNDEQKELHKMLEFIKTNPTYYDSVYVSEISRIGRNPKHTRQVIEDLSKYGCNLYIDEINQSLFREDGTKNHGLTMIVDTLINHAEFEVFTTVSRIKSGLLNSVNKGKAGGSSNYPYGYTKSSDGLLVVDEDEELIIKEIFQLYSQGLGTKRISNILNSKNIPTRYNKLFENREMKYWVGKRGLKGNRPPNYQHRVHTKKGSSIKWSDGQIWSILNNTIYVGKRRFKGKEYPCPRILEDDLFDLCKNIRENKTVRLSSKYVFLLSDIIECGTCKKNYVGRYKNEPRGEKVYKCMSTRYLGGTCGSKGVNIVLIESVLYHLICQSSNLIDFVNFSSEMKVMISGEINKCMGEIQDVEYSIKEEENVPNRILELYEKSMIPIEVFNERYTASNNKINRLKEELTKLTKKMVTKNNILKSPKLSRLKQLRDSIKDREKLKEYFRLFFDKVVVIEVRENVVKVDVYVKLVNESKIKFTIEIGRDGIRKKEKVYRYTIIECNLIINGKGYMIMNKEFKEGGDVKNIGLEVERILSSLNLPLGLEDQRERVVHEDILMNKIIKLDDSQIIEFY